MFYSQFILAKKGPLGTIWIAAHLERKLKKNQVADTDIGDSVDSILFPDVPIALRLSSHLLLGVVRIYSRKVNYLFHDCSEALLKIKQAFRSTAVDLPPEESTAPYHSITLPETFDLDDFELPDTAFLSGDFVDHHISTREQITLQDTLDGTGYSTSQFGLDERFGDGDTSQIGLDLDEELFMDNNSLAFQRGSLPLTFEEGLVNRGDVTTYPNKMDSMQSQYGSSEYMHAERSNDLSEVLGNDRGKHVVSYVNSNRNDDSSHRLVFNIQTPDLNEIFSPDDHMGGPSTIPNTTDMDFAAADPPSPEFIESAHAPSTPGLLDEAIPANVQESSAFSPRDKISTSVIDEEAVCPDATINNTHMDVAPAQPILANLEVLPTSVLTEPKHDFVAPHSSADILTSPDVVHGHIHEVPTDPDSVNGVHPNHQSQCSVGVLATTDTISASGIMHAESANTPVTNISHLASSPTLVLAEPIPNSLTPNFSDGVLTASDVAHVESTPTSTECIRTVPIRDETNHVSTSDRVYDRGETILTDANSNTLASNPNVASGINGNSFMNTSGMSNTGDQTHVKDAQSCLSSHISISSSDFHLRSCSSHLNQTNVSSLEDMISAKGTPGNSFKVAGTCDMPTMEKTQHLNGCSGELQGEFSLQKSTCVSSELNVGVDNPDEVSRNCISKVAQTNPWNCSSSSQIPDPERMLVAPPGYSNQLNDIGQQTADKGVIESDGSVDRISNLSGQKQHVELIDSGLVRALYGSGTQSSLLSTSALQNGMSTQGSGMPRKRKYNKYIPEDDDLLASILVGRRTPAFMIGSTPPLPKVNSLKRPRLTSKVGLSKKRKVLLDDTMVLHADAIRQQLINTEDIRRLRKKAPCTRPEIWRILKSLLEEDIFSETIFTDISADLNALHAKRYDLDQNVRSNINEQYTGNETPKIVEVPTSSDFVRETGEREMAVRSSALPDRVDDGMQGSFGTLTSIDARGCEDAVAIDAHQQVGPSLPSVQAEVLANNQTAFVSTSEVCVKESTGVELGTNAPPHSGNECEMPKDTIPTAEVYVYENRVVELATNSSPHSINESDFQTCSRVGEKHYHGCFNTNQHSLADDATLTTENACKDARPAFIMAEDSNMDMVNIVSSDYPEDGHANAGKTEEVGSLILMQNGCILETDIPEPIKVSGELNDVAVANDYQIEASKAGQVTAGEESDKEKVLIDEERPTSEVHCALRPEMPPYPLPVTIEAERVTSAVGENSSIQEFNLNGELVVESSNMDVAAARESSDFCSAIDDLDTEFLNVDDGIDYDEEADNDEQNAEAAQALENSGWSSRTRGVARYLKTMFDEESGRGRKSVAVDHLLAGKTRKEASRMFFETLVLKTRDYIHVEQENAYNYINIKPRIKLLKSEF